MSWGDIIIPKFHPKPEKKEEEFDYVKCVEEVRKACEMKTRAPNVKYPPIISVKLKDVKKLP